LGTFVNYKSRATFAINLVLAVINESFIMENTNGGSQQVLLQFPSRDYEPSEERLIIEVPRVMQIYSPSKINRSHILPNYNEFRQVQSIDINNDLNIGWRDLKGSTLEPVTSTKLQRFQRWMIANILEASWFTIISTLFIVANLVTLSLDRYPISATEK
jgi:hypothetical protein